MTVKSLHKKLCEILANGNGDMDVCVAINTFKPPKHGAIVSDVHGASEQLVLEYDDNGKPKADTNDFVQHRRRYVLFGFIVGR